jgi:hypothetical protein
MSNKKHYVNYKHPHVSPPQTILYPGLPYAVATDAVLLVSHALGQVKERLKGSESPGIPRFAQDIFRHSVFHKANRSVDPSVEWRPATNLK